MTTDKLAEELPVSKGRNRRSDRYPVAVPIKVKWLEPSGAGVIEFAEVKEVNHGGLLGMRARPGIGSVIELTNLKTASACLLRGALRLLCDVVAPFRDVLPPALPESPSY